jgi:1-deoxy-D-xylulose-5-phosphate synthase
MLSDALDIESGPVAIRYPKTPAPSVDESDVGSGLRGRRVRTGGDVCILAVGKMLEAATEAAEQLAADGVEATVWDVRCVAPLDPEMLEDAAGHPLVVTIEDGIRDGGVGGTVRDRLHAMSGSPPVEVLGVPIEYIPHGNAAEILAGFGLDADGIVSTVRAARST